MFSNSKKIATKLLQKPDKLYISNKYLNLNPTFRNNDSNDFNQHIFVKYMDQRKLEDLKHQYNQDQKNLVIQQQIDYQRILVVENMDTVQAWVRYNKLVDKELTLQACCNSLYLMGQYNITDQQVEEKILNTLKTKGINNLNLSNLLDLKLFLKNNPSSKIFELHTQIENLLHQKSNLYENIVFVQENGNCINEWENATDQNFLDKLIDIVQDKLDNLLMHNSEMRRLKESNDEIQVAQPTQLTENHEEEKNVQLKEEDIQITKKGQKNKMNDNQSKNQQFKQNNK